MEQLLAIGKRKQGKTVMFVVDCRICRKVIGMGDRKVCPFCKNIG